MATQESLRFALAARSSSRTTGSACEVAAPTGSKSRCEKNPTLTSPYLWSMTRSLQTSRPRHWVLHRRVPTWPEAAGCTDPAYAELGIVPLELVYEDLMTADGYGNAVRSILDHQDGATGPVRRSGRERISLRRTAAGGQDGSYARFPSRHRV